MKPDIFTEIKNAPDIISLDVIGSHEIHIRWCPAAGAEKYVIKRSRSKDGTFEKIAAFKANVCDYYDKEIDGEGEYWYKIVAKRKGGGEKSLSRSCHAVCVEVVKIPPVKLLRVSENGKQPVNIDWQPSDKAEGYIVNRRYSFMKAPIKIGETDADTFSFTDTDTVPGQLYYYSIRSFVRTQTNLLISESGNEIPYISLEAPHVLKTVRKFGKRVRFDFRVTAGSDGYVVLRSSEKDGEYTETVRTDNGLSLSCCDTGKKGEKGAYYKFACLKKIDGSEVFGKVSEPVYIKYKL